MAPGICPASNSFSTSILLSTINISAWLFIFCSSSSMVMRGTRAEGGMADDAVTLSADAVELSADAVELSADAVELSAGGYTGALGAQPNKTANVNETVINQNRLMPAPCI
jgi:hypothetical protein